MTVDEHLNQTDEQELKSWVGQIFRPNVSNYSGLEHFEVEGTTIRTQLFFGPWDPQPSPERIAELVALFEKEHPGYSLQVT